MRLSRILDSIATRLLLLALCIVIFGTVVRYFALGNFLRNDLSSVVTDQQLALATYVARDIDFKIAERQASLERLASKLPESTLADSGRLQAWLKERQEEQSLFPDGLLVISSRGFVLADYPVQADRENADVSSQDYVQAALAGTAFVGRPIFGEGKKGPLLPMAFPLRERNGNVRSVLVGITALTAPGFLDALMQSKIGKSSGGVSLVSPRDQLVVASSRPELVLRPTPPHGIDELHDRAMSGLYGAGITVDADHIEQVSASAAVPSAGWFVDARLPTSEAFATVYRLQRFLIERAGLAVLIFLVLASIGLYFIFRPLFRAADLADRMTRDEQPLEPLPIARNDEIGHLISAFNRLLLKLNSNQAELAHLAHFDALTSLPNRALLADRLSQAMHQTQRHAQLLAVAYLDLDGFKSVNDNFGHETGDEVLIALANRVQQVLREGDTVSRLGGDEFVIVLLDQQEFSNCVPILTRVLKAVMEPLHVRGFVVQVSASIGVTFFPQEEDVDPDQLLRQADQAMYKAKLAGKGRYCIFDTSQDRNLRDRHENLERVRIALERREFVLYYQPKVNMRTGLVIGAEALIRWQHPERGLLAPGVFLPLIEDHPLAVDVGEWVIDAALTQLERWQAAGLPLTVSVNVGARQLQQAGFVNGLRAKLDAHPTVKPSSLELEILETSALEDLTTVSNVIEACREFGVKFALDDFGTGYSSLTYLKHLSVSQLKIDQSFVRNMLRDPDDLAILGGILGLAIAFRTQVIAEGVETIEHGEMLLRLGCELAQGYGIARPMPAADLPDWVGNWRKDAAWHDVLPVDREDFPLLFAGIEHRAWFEVIEEYLNGGGDIPCIQHDQCRFGAWLAAEGKTRCADQPFFQTIERLHRQIHAVVADLTDFHAQGRHAEISVLRSDFNRLRDTFFGQLRLMLSKPDVFAIQRS